MMSPVKIENPKSGTFKNRCMDAKAASPKSAVVSHRKFPNLEAGSEALFMVVWSFVFKEFNRQHISCEQAASEPMIYLDELDQIDG